ncbi:DegT/DnrJ/EryC1/StrS family aminotransferase [Saccharicrinis fermentans]|uniref:GDP-perosamine synthase n=1 Tax=Saccharicrinis fermentans DSM 9555 = JCM 21142 TaxID=869213 RepID=W7Y5A9_9BACT|nr:aminotransferase class I/II-fold pyridoxal phosphate-dependent enzyme [Saccharicrinis fermentans]GAF03272.1 UDP-4-amino-4-deoxy-L-arabinose-oxoglutarate aminotransferase [Saccharicrinis fermentans DSM 9555 = JCM 21142]
MHTNKQRVYLSSPHMSGDEQKYIREAFDNNWIAPLGPNVNAFEETLAEYCGVKYAAALSSGTSAIHLALIMLGVGVGDEVLVSTFTFSASVNPIVYQGAKPVFIDSERDTWNMDPELLEQALKARKAKGQHFMPKAIIIVHLYGMPAKMDQIVEVANYYGVPIIEDAAEALGSRYDEKPLGSWGMMSALSFNGNKIITTSGGGALLSNHKKQVDDARFLATQARDQAPHYQHSQIGYNYRMSNVLAGIGRGQMEVIDDRVQQRRNNFSFYKAQLQEIACLSFQEESDARFFSNRWLTTMLIDPEKSSVTHAEISAELEKHNIESRPLWKPMHLQPVFERYSAYLNGVSEDLFSKGICLPSGSNLSESDRSKIVDVIKQCFI